MSKTELTNDQAQALANTADTSAPPRGYWQDANGNLVPVAKVKPIDKERHAVVMSLAQSALAMSDALRHFKLQVMSEIATFVQLSAAEYDVNIGGEKGNVTLVSFDGRFKIVRQVSDTLAFDERLQVAKALIDECVHKWAKGANKNIQALVNHAFQVDKTGKVCTGRILALRQIDIKDDDWLRAMEAIADSMKTVSSKSYVRFYERNAGGEYIAIPLDASTV
jgi:hypothetical protein